MDEHPEPSSEAVYRVGGVKPDASRHVFMSNLSLQAAEGLATMLRGYDVKAKFIVEAKPKKASTKSITPDDYAI